MKIKEISVAFIDNERPRVRVRMEGDLADELKYIKYTMRTSHEHNAGIYYGKAGDFVSCLARQHGQDKRTLANEVAINKMFTNREPVMGAVIEDDTGTTLHGHVDALAVARHLAINGGAIALAVVEWPSGIRVYEPVLVTDNPEPWRAGDKIIFLATGESITLH